MNSKTECAGTRCAFAADTSENRLLKPEDQAIVTSSILPDSVARFPDQELRHQPGGLALGNRQCLRVRRGES